jgi:cytochrome b561
LPDSFHELRGTSTQGAHSHAYVLFVLVPCMGLSMFSSETEGADAEIFYVQEDYLQAASAGNTCKTP